MKASLQPKPMYCSRDYYYSSRFNQQYEKPTPNICKLFIAVIIESDNKRLVILCECGYCKWIGYFLERHLVNVKIFYYCCDISHLEISVVQLKHFMFLYNLVMKLSSGCHKDNMVKR